VRWRRHPAVGVAAVAAVALCVGADPGLCVGADPGVAASSRHRTPVRHHAGHGRRHARKKTHRPLSRAAERRALIAALRRNPRLIGRGSWLKRASLFDLTIPAILRLQQVSDPASSENTAVLDFGSLAGGSHTLRLGGGFPVLMSFNGADQVGFPGDIGISFPSGATSLVTSSVPLQVDSYLANSQSAASSPGCGDFATTGGYGGTAAGVDDPGLLGDQPANPGSVDDIGPAPYDTTVSPPNATAADIKVRTGPLQMSVAGGVDNLGTANLFGLAPAGDQPVRLHVNLEASVYTLVRVAPSDGAYGALDAYLQCRQLWTGGVAPSDGSGGAPVTNVFPADLTGTMHVSPALTTDGRIRLATLSLSTPGGDAAPVSLTACLDPYQTLAQGYPAGSGAGPSLTSPYVYPQAGSGPPPASCGAPGGPLDNTTFNWAPSGRTESLTGQFSIANLTADLVLGS